MKKHHINPGDYGYAKKYKNTRLFMSFILFLCIVTDVVMALIIYQTRSTLLTIIACVLSLPFAKLFIGYLLSFKFTPLKKDEFISVEALKDKYDVNMLYDISISKSEGILFYPAMAVKNNNIISYVPNARTNEETKKYNEYMKKSYEGTKYKMRVVVTSDLARFEKELAKLTPPAEEQELIDKFIGKRILELGV